MAFCSVGLTVYLSGVKGAKFGAMIVNHCGIEFK